MRTSFLYMMAVVVLACLSMDSAFGSIRLRTQVIEQRASDSQNMYTTMSAVIDQQSLEQVKAEAGGERLPLLVEFGRKITAGDRKQLRHINVAVVSYIPDNALLVLASEEVLQNLVALEGVKWVGGYVRDYKLDPALNMQPRTGGLELDTAIVSTTLDIIISTMQARDVYAVEKVVDSLDGVVVESGRGERWGTVRAVVPDDGVSILAAMPEVEWIEPYRELELMNNVAAQSARMNVERVWTNHGLTGVGQILAVADSGLDTGDRATIHPDFSNRIHAADGWVSAGSWGDYNGHGTHVAGSVLGSGAAYSNGLYRGMAYESELVFQSIGYTNGSSSVHVPQPLTQLFVAAYTNEARIHSDSWGASASGAYTANSRSVDEFMWDYDSMLVVFSAGNSGRDADSNGVIDPGSLGAPGSAKNCLTVGAAESLRPSGSGGYSDTVWATGSWAAYYPVEPIRSDLISTPWDGTNQGMAAFSSRGPCADGRMKPDVVAPGTDIISCRSHMPGAGTLWGTGTGILAGSVSNDYCFSGGTSMSTPLVSGSAGLVRQFLVERAGITNPSAALIKGLLVNGARSIAPGQYGTNAYEEIGNGPRPSIVEGWGQVDLAGTLYPADGGTTLFWDRGRMETGQNDRYAVVTSGTNAMSITLAWSDYPASLSAAQQLVNDLDICLVQPSGVRVYANGGTSYDRTNNLLGIDVAVAEAGTNYIELSGFNVPEGPQPYSLIVRCQGEAVAEHIVRSACVQGGRFFSGETSTIDAVVTTNASGVAAVVAAYRVNGNTWQYSNMVYLDSGGMNQQYSTTLPAMSAADEIEFYVYAMACDMTMSFSETNSATVESKTVYVSQDGSMTWPYYSWDTAFRSIADALEYADEGFTIYVTNGVYRNGTLILEKDLKLLSVNGPENTFVDALGAGMCMIVVADADVSGFTLVNGFSENGGCLGMSAGVVSNCIIRNGQATRLGGGVELVGGTIDDCVISNNYAAVYGGGLLIRGGLVQNCLLIDNSSGSDGGAVEHWGGIISNSTVVLNHSGNYAGGVDVGDPYSEIYNCIIVSNTAAVGGDNWYEWFDIDFMYCCSRPVPEGVGNFDLDPMFADFGARDFHLQSEEGRFVSEGVWTNDPVSSPCVDMGDPGSDYSSEPSPNGLRINMGRYAGTPEASRGADDEFNLLVISSVDAVHPKSGRYGLSRGIGMFGYVTASLVENMSTQFVAAGWCLSGITATNGMDEGTGTSVSFVLTNSAILTWRWNTNYLLTAHAGPNGVVSGSTNGWYSQNSLVSLSGDADSFYAFSGWTGTFVTAVNPVMFSMASAVELWSHFAEAYTTNGVPQLWLAQYGWTNDFDVAENSDQDADGALTWQEYVAGTVPTNEHSVLALHVIKQEGEPIELNWAASSNRTYSLYCSTNLNEGITNYMFGIQTVLPMDLSVDDTIHTNEQTLYYRIKVRRD